MFLDPLVKTFAKIFASNSTKPRMSPPSLHHILGSSNQHLYKMRWKVIKIVPGRQCPKFAESPLGHQAKFPCWKNLHQLLV